MTEATTTKILRDVKAIVVPYGDEVTLQAGSEATITQALGGTYTVIVEGNMFRISNDDADALGKEVIELVNTAFANASLEDKIWAQLRTCYDPEIPVNIVDLGLIYEVITAPAEQASESDKTDQTSETDAMEQTESTKKIPDHKFTVTIKMTLTAPGCGMGPMIAGEARAKVLALPEVQEVVIEMVFDPPWDRSRMSDAAKLMLNM